MKKLLILFATAMMAIGVNAQTLIAEKDFTGGFEGDYPYAFGFFQNVEGSISSNPDGVAITIGSQTLSFWESRLTVFPEGSFNLTPTGNYKVVVIAKFPTNGTVGINIRDLEGDGAYSTTYVTTTGDFQEVGIEVSAFGEIFEGRNCELSFHCGEFLGTTILKKVQIYEMEASEEIDGLTYFFDKDNKTAAIKKANRNYNVGDIPGTVTHKGEEYTVTKIMDQAFSGCLGLPSVTTIPDGVTYIGYVSFASCLNLEEITIPASIKYIGSRAFQLCERMKRVTVLAETPPIVYESSFNVLNGEPFSNNRLTLKVPDASMDVYKATEPWSRFSDFELLSKQKCATPKISVENGKMNFSCDTEGVEFHYEIFTSLKGDGNGIKLPETLKITVYASKEGWYDSAIETGEIPLSAIADANGDGVVDAADIVRIANIIMGK